MDVRVGLWRRLSTKELMLLNYGVGEDSWESLGLQGDPTSPPGDQPWDFFGRNDAKAETPVLWPPHAKSWLIGKDSDAGRDCGQEEKGTTEDEMAGWQHWLNGRLSELRKLLMDREAWHASIHGVAKSRTPLSDWTELNWGSKRLRNEVMILIIHHCHYYWLYKTLSPGYFQKYVSFSSQSRYSLPLMNALKSCNILILLLCKSAIIVIWYMGIIGWFGLIIKLFNIVNGNMNKSL